MDIKIKNIDPFAIKKLMSGQKKWSIQTRVFKKSY